MYPSGVLILMTPLAHKARNARSKTPTAAAVHSHGGRRFEATAGAGAGEPSVSFRSTRLSHIGSDRGVGPGLLPGDAVTGAGPTTVRIGTGPAPAVSRLGSGVVAVERSGFDL